jgi:hypothetical protein
MGLAGLSTGRRRMTVALMDVMTLLAAMRVMIVLIHG